MRERDDARRLRAGHRRVLRFSNQSIMAKVSLIRNAQHPADDHQPRLTLFVRSPQRPRILITENLSEVTVDHVDRITPPPADEE